MKHEQPLELHWTLHGPGMAMLSWTLGVETVEIHTSYLGNALDSLMQAGLDLDLGSSASIAVFLSEPGGHRIFFSGASREVYVQIVEFSDLHSIENRWKGGKLCWEKRILTDQFIDAVQRMSETILEEYGQEGYRKTWGSDFPSELLRMLETRQSKQSDDR